jgi:hypothetical protein
MNCPFCVKGRMMFSGSQIWRYKYREIILCRCDDCRKLFVHYRGSYYDGSVFKKANERGELK